MKITIDEVKRMFEVMLTIAPSSPLDEIIDGIQRAANISRSDWERACSYAEVSLITKFEVFVSLTDDGARYYYNDGRSGNMCSTALRDRDSEVSLKRDAILDGTTAYEYYSCILDVLKDAFGITEINVEDSK